MDDDDWWELATKKGIVTNKMAPRRITSSTPKLKQEDNYIEIKHDGVVLRRTENRLAVSIDTEFE